jgi:hypothetical protein
MTEAAFAQALLDRESPPPAGLVAWNGSDPAARFAVYRNNVVASLTAALADTFDVVRQLVGEAFFATLARHFIAAHPPTAPVLAGYGAALPGFIEHFLDRHAPAAGLPYLADVARLEFARVQAFHAADAAALDPAAVAAMARLLADPAALAGTTLQLHPSLAVVASRHAVASLWSAHQGALALEDVDPALPEAALVLRADDDAAVVRVPHAVARFVAALQAGAALGDAAAQAAQAAQATHGEPPDGIAFDPAAAFGVLLHHPLIVAWHAPRPEGSPP